MYHIDALHHPGSLTLWPLGLYAEVHQCLKPVRFVGSMAERERERQVDGDFLTSQKRETVKKWNSDREGGQTESIPPPIRFLSFKVGHTFRHTLC